MVLPKIRVFHALELPTTANGDPLYERFLQISNNPFLGFTPMSWVSPKISQEFGPIYYLRSPKHSLFFTYVHLCGPISLNALTAT
jgi:hypothetical protein